MRLQYWQEIGQFIRLGGNRAIAGSMINIPFLSLANPLASDMRTKFFTKCFSGSNQNLENACFDPFLFVINPTHCMGCQIYWDLC